jgi:hypothetical protein
MAAAIAAPPVAARATRARGAAACAYDLATLAALLAGGVALAAGWLLARSELGRVDAPALDAAVAGALLGALAPAWAAAQARELWAHGRTSGGARLALPARVLRARWRRAAWLALHPALLPAWWWLVATALVAEVTALAALLALCAAVLSLLAIASATWALLRPHARPWHYRLAAWRT